MPASASLSIAAVTDQVEALGRPDPVALASDLRRVLSEVVDPRKRRGVRHGLVVVLTAAVCAVAAGARSLVAIAEWIADLPAEVAVVLGVDRRCPSESTIRAAGLSGTGSSRDPRLPGTRTPRPGSPPRRRTWVFGDRYGYDFTVVVWPVPITRDRAHRIRIYPLLLLLAAGAVGFALLRVASGVA